MKLVLEPKETFGELLYLGYAEKYAYVNGVKTDNLVGHSCRLGCSEVGDQIEVVVPPTVSVDAIKFGQKVLLGGKVTCDPYGNSSKESTFVDIRLRCTAETILDAATVQGQGAGQVNPKPNVGKTEEKKPS